MSIGWSNSLTHQNKTNVVQGNRQWNMRNFMKVAYSNFKSYGPVCSSVTLKLNYTTGSVYLSSLLMLAHMASVCGSKQGRPS